MSKYSIQFQKGMSIFQFQELFGTEKQCEEHLYSLKWPQGFICPRCGHHHATSFIKGKHRVYQCKNCQRQTSLLVGTIFERTHLPLTKWYMAIYLVSEAKTSIAALDLHRRLGINHKSAWLMLQKLMHCMTEEEKNKPIAQRIEMDDAYLGGSLKGGAPERGSENKQPFIAAVETTPDERHLPMYLKLDPVETFSAEQVKLWTENHILRGSHVVTDPLSCFSGVEQSEAYIEKRNEVLNSRAAMKCTRQNI